jgi:large subunit ribosomal protein L14
MKAIPSKVPRTLNVGAELVVADNSGARTIRITGVKRGKNKKGQQQSTRMGELIKASVRKGPVEMKKQLFWAVIIRQKKEFRRKTGERVCFEDNAAVLLKDEEGNPKGTQIKGPISKEVADRWPFLAKIAPIIV